jgi:3-hydroxyisobutyrate dehydrogenase-like beta-hydroxyacid dehydrogenase
MADKNLKVALIGLGSMGMAMGQRLLDHGVQVSAWNRSPQPVAALVAAGATAVELEETFQNPVVMSILSNDAAALAVFSDDLLASAAAGTVHINMSTLSTDASRVLAARHSKHNVTYIASPVLGRPTAIAAGKLLMITAGDKDAIDSVMPVLEVASAKVWFVGEDHEKANLVKLGLNYNLIHALQAIGESVALVEAGGVDPLTFIEILTHTSFTGAVYTGYGPMIVNRKYEPAGFAMALGLKDIKLVEQAAEELDLKLPVAPVLREMFEIALQDKDLADLDWSAIAEVTRQRKVL